MLKGLPRIFHNTPDDLAGGVADALAAGIAAKAPPLANPFDKSQDVVYRRVNGQTVASAPGQQLPSHAITSQPQVPDQVLPSHNGHQQVQQQIPAQQPVVQPQAAPDPAPAAPQVPAPDDPTEGGKWHIIRHPENGRILTRVLNTPEAMAQKIASDQEMLRLLRDRPLEFQTPQTPQTPPKPQGPTPEEIRQRDVQRAREVAQKNYLPVDPNANVDPIANTVAEITAQIREELRNEFKTEFETRQEQADRIARGIAMDAELAQVKAEDPWFDETSPQVAQIKRSFPGISPREARAMLLGFDFLNYRQNGAQQTNGHTQAPPQAAPAAPQAQRVPDQMWQQPSGSAPPQANGQNSDPEVIAAVEAHKRYNAMTNKPVTPESIARITDIVLKDKASRQRQSQGFY